MVANPVTTYLYATSLILCYGSLGLAFAVGGSTTIFGISGVLCILSLALLQGLRCAITGKTVYVAPGYVGTTRQVVQSDGVHTEYGSRWSSGGTYNARHYGLLYGLLGLFLGLMIGFGMDMEIQDTFPAITLVASTIFAIIGAMAFRP